MPPARRKAPKIDAPSSLSEATDLIARYLETLAAIEQAKADADAAIRQIEHARDELIAPVEQGAKGMFAQLRTWWAVARDDLTEGKRKSIELAGAIIGDRTTPPSLKLPKGWKADEAVDFIKSLIEDFPGVAELLRVKTDLEKPALIKLLGNATSVGPVVDRIREEGFRTDQREEFFIDRAGPKDADPVIEPVDGEAVS